MLIKEEQLQENRENEAIDLYIAESSLSRQNDFERTNTGTAKKRDGVDWSDDQPLLQMVNSTKTSQLKMPTTGTTQAVHPQLMMPQNQQRFAKSRESATSAGTDA